MHERLMTMLLSLEGKCHATIISAYASMMTNPDEVKEKFYEVLETLVIDVPKENKLIILGDFNARVGSDYQTWWSPMEELNWTQQQQ